MINIDIRNKLENLSEENYKNFSSKLIPNVTNMLGIRIPTLKKIANELSKKTDIVNYILSDDEIYFEEIMLKGLIIGYLKIDIDDIIEIINNFVPKINNWAVCDSFCASLKITKKNMSKMFNFIMKYKDSHKEYELRFLIVMLMDYYINEEYIDTIFSTCNDIYINDYYVKMAVAWILSVCFIKYTDKTKVYLNNNDLDDFTYNKALQKAIESYRVSEKDKKYLRSIKRKIKK